MLMPTVSIAALFIFILFPLSMLNGSYYAICLQVLLVSMDKYLQGLFVLANDAAPEVRKLVSISAIGDIYCKHTMSESS